SERMEEWFGEPFGDTSAVPTFRVCDFARQYVTVALSGDGGDELFGGYRWYQIYNQVRMMQKAMPFLPEQGFDFPSWMPQRRRLTLLSLRDPVALYAHLRGGLQGQRLNQWRERLGIPADYDPLWAYRAHYRPDLPPRKAAQVMDFHTYLPDDILTKVDRVSMAVALECRPPFLSRAMIEFAYSLPESFLYKEGQLKGGLKAACAELLPSSIIGRGKQGFSVPDSGWRKAMTKQSGSLQEAFLDHALRKAA
ncbi:MAG TPA: asparagine synthase C-terminal domain-containing protein, partial [Micavibrio sp.]